MWYDAAYVAGATHALNAIAASMTGESGYGADFHLREVRRLGPGDQTLTEAVEVIQIFNTVTKIADALHRRPRRRAPCCDARRCLRVAPRLTRWQNAS